MKSHTLAAAVLAAFVAAGVSLTAQAADPIKMEKCYGVAKAGKNDCGTKGGNSCAGQVKFARSSNAWIFVPKGTCEKIEGGSLEPVTSSGDGSSTESGK